MGRARARTARLCQRNQSRVSPGFFSDHDELRLLSGRWRRSIRPGRHRPQRLEAQAGSLDEQTQLARGETRRPEIDLAFVPLLVAHDGPLVVDARASVESFAFLEVADAAEF